jgi:hypothetical protein
VTPSPDPWREIRALGVRTLQGASYWSSRPVTRLDLVVGEYDDISSATVPGFTESLLEAFPGLVEHRCSVGERGGFLQRLRRGTYAPHIVEHLALELQDVAGDEVGYGRARGGDRNGEYTVVVEHRHPSVGRRAVEEALEMVRRAFAGQPLGTIPALERLAAAREAPLPDPLPAVRCVGIGGGDLEQLRLALAAHGHNGTGVGLAPARVVLDHGLPVSRAEVGIVLDAEPDGLPERYRGDAEVVRLLGVLGDVLPTHGVVVLPATERRLREHLLAEGLRVALFAVGSHQPVDESDAWAVARVLEKRVVVTGTKLEEFPLGRGVAPSAAAAAALAAVALRRAPANGEE